MSILNIILDSFDSLIRGLNAFLKTKDLTIGAILAGLAPIVVILNRISREKEKRLQSQRIEQRQLHIESNISNIMHHLGVEDTWKPSLSEDGLKNTVRLSYAKWFISYLQRKGRKTMDFLKSNISKKLLAILIGSAVTALNHKLNLNISTEELVTFLIAVGGYVVAQAHLDGKKYNSVAKVVQEAVKTYPDMNYEEILPTIKSVHVQVTSLHEAIKRNDGSAAYKEAVNAYLTISKAIEALKHPEPLEKVE